MSGDLASTAAGDRIAEAPVGRTVLRLGLPLALGMASHALVNLVDLLLVCRLGPEAAAAAHVATTINFAPMIVGNGLSVAAIALLSLRLGRGEREGARAFARRSLAFMAWLGAVVAVVTALPAAPSVDTIGVAGAVRRDAIHYLVVSNLGCLPMFVLMQTTAVMRAFGETAMPLALLLGANVLNLGLDVLLLFGWDALGVPALGVTGAAYATVASRAVAAAIGWWWLVHRGICRGGAVAAGIAASADGADGGSPRVIGPMWRLAWPQVVQIGLRAALVWGITAIVQHRLSTDGTAALAVTTRLDTLVLFAALGFASAATTVAGRAVARGEARRARAAGLWAGAQALVVGFLIVFSLQIMAAPLLRQFLPGAGAPTVDAGVLYLTIAATSQPFAALALGSMGAVHGAGRMLAPLVVDLVGFAGLGAALLLSARLELRAVYLALVGGAATIAAMHTVFVWRGRWTRPSATTF